MFWLAISIHIPKPGYDKLTIVLSKTGSSLFTIRQVNRIYKRNCLFLVPVKTEDWVESYGSSWQLGRRCLGSPEEWLSGRRFGTPPKLQGAHSCHINYPKAYVTACISPLFKYVVVLSNWPTLLTFPVLSHQHFHDMP